jgi:hypothetical protein
MSEDNELNPEIEAALRDVPAADPSLRDQHIAAALGGLAPAATTKRRNLFAAAAAVLVLAGAGFAVSQNSGDTPPAVAADTTVTSVPKASSNPSCAEEFSGLWGDSGSLGSFERLGVTYEMIQRKGVLSLYFAKEPCTKVGDIDYWAAIDNRNKGTDAPTEAIECSILSEPIARFTDQSSGSAYSFGIVSTTDGVSLYLEDRCNEPIGSIALPASGD